MRARLFTPILATLLCLASAARADWSLDPSGSTLSFVTVKAQDVAEVHTFGELSGAVGADGQARVVIQLASVNTMIPIRDERMRDILFQTSMFPTADVTAKLDMDKLGRMAPGTSMVLTTELVLTLGESTLPVTTDLLVARLAPHRAMVATLQPIIVNAGSVGLADGVEQLREIAGLPSISKAVPVSFVLQFVEAVDG